MDLQRRERRTVTRTGEKLLSERSKRHKKGYAQIKGTGEGHKHARKIL